MSSEPYGAKGCSCWPNEDYDPDYASWDHRMTEYLPNSACRFHGVLAEFLPPRTDTGVYRVLTPEEVRAQSTYFDRIKDVEPIELPGLPPLSEAHRQDRGCEPADFHEANHPADGSRCPGGRIEGPDGWSMDATEHVVVHDLGPEPITIQEARALAEAMLRDPASPRISLTDTYANPNLVGLVPNEFGYTTTGKDGRGIFTTLRRWGRRAWEFVTHSGFGWL